MSAEIVKAVHNAASSGVASPYRRDNPVMAYTFIETIKPNRVDLQA